MKDHTVRVYMAVQGLYCVCGHGSPGTILCVWTWQFRDYTVCVDMAVQGLYCVCGHGSSGTIQTITLLLIVSCVFASC